MSLNTNNGNEKQQPYRATWPSCTEEVKWWTPDTLNTFGVCADCGLNLFHDCPLLCRWNGHLLVPQRGKSTSDLNYSASGCSRKRSSGSWKWTKSRESSNPSPAPSVSYLLVCWQIRQIFTTVLSHWDFFNGKFGSHSLGKASCDSCATQSMAHAVCFSVSIINWPDMDYMAFSMCKWSFCTCFYTGPWFIVSSKGLLWGLESVQNFESRETNPQLRTKPTTKRSLIHVVAMFDRA